MESENNKLLFDIMTDHSSVPNILLDSYREMGLSEEETLFLIILLRLKNKKTALTLKSVIKESVYNESEIMILLAPLIDKGFLSLADGNEIVLDGLLDKFIEVKDWNTFKTEQKIPKERKNSREDKSFSELYQCFEDEMGRPLSPIEGEQIRYWYKSQTLPAEIIKKALERAVLMGKYNFRYIDAILSEWSRQGVRSLSDIERVENKYNNGRQKNSNTASSSRIFRGEQKPGNSDDADIVL